MLASNKTAKEEVLDAQQIKAGTGAEHYNEKSHIWFIFQSLKDSEYIKLWDVTWLILDNTSKIPRKFTFLPNWPDW